MRMSFKAARAGELRGNKSLNAIAVRSCTPPTALHTSAHQIAFDCKLIAALHEDTDADADASADADAAASAGGI